MRKSVWKIAASYERFGASVLSSTRLVSWPTSGTLTTPFERLTKSSTKFDVLRHT